MSDPAPFIMVPPWWNAHSQATARPALPNEVPARILAAMRFLEASALKTADRVAVNDSQIRDVPGQPLTPAEECAHAAACDLLESYFRGKAEPNVWEGLALDAVVCSLPSPAPEGRVLPCPNCLSVKSASACPYCKGSGKVVLSPWQDDREQP